MPDINKFNRILEGQRRDIAEKIETLSKGTQSDLKDSTNELSGYDNHPADLGSETFERTKDFALNENYTSILSKISVALKKIDEGTYGFCEFCHGPIEEERLNALPYAALCIDCKRKEETKIDHNKRPIEEDTLGPPFGRSFLDGTDRNFYDGEDAWQDVARYGTSESPQDVPGSLNYNEIYVDSEEKPGIVEKVDKKTHRGSATEDSE